jgi:hypothetical protein
MHLNVDLRITILTPQTSANLFSLFTDCLYQILPFQTNIFPNKAKDIKFKKILNTEGHVYILSVVEKNMVKVCLFNSKNRLVL